MSKCKDHNKTLWYVEETYNNVWSRDTLDNQIAMKPYECSRINPIKTEVIEKSNVDNETIGLLLCKEADTYVAQTTLNKSNSKIGVQNIIILKNFLNI